MICRKPILVVDHVRSKRISTLVVEDWVFHHGAQESLPLSSRIRMTSLFLGNLSRPWRGFVYTLHFAGTFCWFKIFTEHFFDLKSADGPSMYPTIHVRGDSLLISKFYKYGRGVELGDIIIYKKPHDLHTDAAKRVIGLPGDYVLKDPPLDDKTVVEEDAEMIQVPEAHVWVAGDDAPWSNDSKDYGPVPMGLILGKALGRVWLPFNYQSFENPFNHPASALE
ncbi:hypothetical protein FQN57_006409 [Myotisia sp. PD_48]|nr:hypothetical protein FQN57_006409 [Myotisia sp. PD_48]